MSQTTATVVAQVSQQDMFKHVLNDPLLGSSIYVNIALAGLTLLLFVYMARSLTDPRAKLIVVSVMGVSAVSIASYTGLASGLTIGILEMPEGHAMYETTTELAHSGEEVDGTVSLWGRYLTWAFSTPFILLALGLIAGSNLTKIFTAIVFDIGIMITGLAAALTTSSYPMRWAWYGISVTFFLVVVYILLFEWPEDARQAGTADIFNTLKILTVVLWFGYTIWWALGNEGLAVIESVGLTSWGYSAFDIVAKYLFSFLVVKYVVDNVEKVSAGSDYGATSSAIPADD
ncbi:bacteriorhodopsin [Halapricum desulfuricans]|uniref:Bacteriorhodopsin n=1 Tax=Halapricum desulfuricans TaxID=2841257 RepID=A0A897NR89_9EURY|nr:bacteriorhodopsin [Halapricum desulfuricans]QSG08166.1 Bacteriorhodopsin [Halapricum desulfuricans]QSG12706.1 Bacteriorhodopsin [Halapricum desulfuricans]